VRRKKAAAKVGWLERGLLESFSEYARVSRGKKANGLGANIGKKIKGKFGINS